MTDTVLEIRDVHTVLGGNSIHRGIDLAVRRGEVVALIGGSGTGKSVLLREIIGLLKPRSGRIELFGQSVWDATPAQLNLLRRRFGVLFQDGALFSSLNVEDNVATPLFEHTTLPHGTCRQLARLKLGLANLPADVAKKKPSELSGGMRKRVALARALALDPELLFLDEPTSGLDPISARAFDRLIRLLADSLGLTIFLVTHDLDTLFSIIDRVIVLSNGRVLGSGTVAELKQLDDPWLSAYFAARTEEASPHGN
ncbi:MAG: ABC transporter ATP-binding protein [Thiobacillus sp.]|nr:ABC transporter ATP-binding protein [Thiobacillus sp.]